MQGAGSSFPICRKVGFFLELKRQDIMIGSLRITLQYQSLFR